MEEKVEKTKVSAAPVEKKKARGRPFQAGDANPRRRNPEKSGNNRGKKYNGLRLKEAVFRTLDNLGGARYLGKLARGEKTQHLFVQLLTKVMPTEIVGREGGPIEIDLQVLHIAKEGLARLSDEDLETFHGLLVKIGVNDIVSAAANDETARPLLPAPTPAQSAEAAA